MPFLSAFPCRPEFFKRTLLAPRTLSDPSSTPNYSSYRAHGPSQLPCLAPQVATVREAAVIGAGELGTGVPWVLPALKQATGDPDSRVQSRAKQVLARVEGG